MHDIKILRICEEENLREEKYNPKVIYLCATTDQDKTISSLWMAGPCKTISPLWMAGPRG